MLSKLKADQLSARKNKDAVATSLLTTLLSEASIVGKNQNRDSTDAEVLAVVKKFLKNNTEFLSSINEGHTEYGKLIVEKEILESYMPTQLSDDKLKDIVLEYKQSNDNVNVGAVMKYMKEHYDGQYDGKVLSNIVKEIV